MVFEKPLDHVLVDTMGVQPALTHPACKVGNATEVGINGVGRIAALDVRPVTTSSWVFCTRNGESYFNEAKGTANGFDSFWQRFMRRLLNETRLETRFAERDLLAKCASDAKSLEHA
jgi:hypothetical protein